MRPLFPLRVFVVFVLLVGCDAPPPAPGRPNFLVIAPDTLRADRLDASQDGAPVMPVLGAVARRGVRFRTMVSNAGWTLPALAAFLGGTWPLVPTTEGGGSLTWLRPEMETLPEILRLEGYSTAVFWGSTLVTAAPEFSRGFATVDKQTDADADPADHPGRWLQARPTEPFFALVHDVDLQFVRPADGSGDTGGGLEITGHVTTLAGRLGAEAARAQAIADYNHTITRFDTAMGRLLETLEDEGYADHTVVIVLSNHGLDLGDHGGFMHGTAFDASLRVPLVIADPRRPPGASDALVQTLDVAPTVLALAGIPNAVRFTGTDLTPLLATPAATFPDRVVYSVNSARLMSARTRTQKLIRVQPRAQDPVMWMSFDLQADPDEARPNAVGPRALQEGIEAFRAARLGDARGARPTGDDAALRKALQEQGYWENVRADEPATGEPRSQGGPGPRGPPGVNAGPPGENAGPPGVNAGPPRGTQAPPASAPPGSAPSPP